MACCGPKCSKAFVIFYNILFWFSGCALVTLGVVLLCDTSYSYYFTLLTRGTIPVQYLQYSAFACIGLGGFILFVGFFGCCGALQDSKCMLGTYVFCLLLVFLVEAALALICVWCRFFLPADISLILKSKVVNEYGLENADAQFDNAINFSQYELRCCGIEGHEDYTHSRWVNKSIAEKNPKKVPDTCCEKKEGWQEDDEPWKNPQPKDSTRCQASDPVDYNGNLNPEGCWPKIHGWYLLHIHILMATSGGLALLQILGVIFSICLIRNIGEEA